MTNIAFIGDSGHGGNFTINGCAGLQDSVNFVACAPGSEGETIKMIPSLKAFGSDPKLYDDYKEMLAKEKIDIVCVDPYYGDHAKAAIAAFEAGCHVFCEKPIATTMEDFEAVKEAWKKAGTEFTAMLNFRYNGNFYKAYQMIQEGRIGEVRLLNGQKSYKFGTRPEFAKKRATYGGTIPWVGIHAIDWLQWLSGKKFVSASAAQTRLRNNDNGELETDALVLYQMEDEVLASVTIDYLNPKTAPTWGDDRVRVVGTKGVIDVRPGSVTLLNDEADGYQTIEFGPDEQMFPDFLGQCLGDGRKCRVTAEDAFNATEAAIRAQIAADTGSIVLF